MAESVRELSEAEIHKRLADARQELFTMRLQRSSGKLQNAAKIAATRRAAARLLTELRARELAGEAAGRRGAGR
jgi:large subunit ribosomal protein L29